MFLHVSQKLNKQEVEFVVYFIIRYGYSIRAKKEKYYYDVSMGEIS